MTYSMGRGPSSQGDITNRILDRLIFHTRWLKWVDARVEEDPRRWGPLANILFALVLVPVVMLLWLFRLLDASQLVGRTDGG